MIKPGISMEYGSMGLERLRQQSILGIVGLMFSTQLFAHGRASAGTVDLDRQITFPDTQGYQTLVVDLHTHSVFSDGHVWPTIRVAEALKDGLDAMAVTEHLELQPHRADIPHEDRNRAISESQDAAENSDLIIIPGSEITRDYPAGHINAIFITDANALFKVDSPPENPKDARAYYQAAAAWPAQAAVDAAAEQGAFLFWNHPHWGTPDKDGIARMNKFHKANIKAGKLHGIEIANTHDYSAEAHAIALKYKLTMMGVSDVHDLIDWDYEPHNGGHRPVNLLLAKERTAAGIKEALLAKRSLVWFKNLLIGRAAELDAMLAASMTVTKASYRSRYKIVDISISNSSDAAFELRNLSKLTLMGQDDRIVIKANDTTSFSVKAGADAEKVRLKFSVENALLAPRKHPVMTFDLIPTQAEQ